MIIAVLQTVFSILAASFGAILVKTTILGTNSTQKNDFDKVYRSKSTAIYTEHSYENCFKLKFKVFLGGGRFKVNSNGFYEKEADEDDYFYFESGVNNFCYTHFHKNLEMVFVKSGTHRVRINGDERVLTKGNIAVSNSYDVHKYDYENDSTVDVIVLGREYFRHFSMLFDGVFESFLSPCDSTDDIFGALQNLENNRTESVLLRYGYVDILLGKMAQAYKLTKPSNKNNDIIVKILTFINENYCDNISLEIIGKKFGYDKNYLSGLFNKFVGMHLRDYVNSLRVEKVKLLMFENNTKNRTFTDIALDCGFESPNTYYRALKKFSDK